MKIIAKNRKAYFNYEISQTIEAGISLHGNEVKSIRAGNVQLNNSYAIFSKDNEIFLLNLKLGKLINFDRNFNPERSKKLLLKKSQIKKLGHLKETQNISLVPIKIYWKKNLVKVEIGVGKGKKLFDKRETIKKRDQERFAQKKQKIR